MNTPREQQEAQLMKARIEEQRKALERQRKQEEEQKQEKKS
jgi:hypothetical protein